MPLLLSRILNKPLWTGWMLCRLLADPKHPVQRWMPHTSIECASLCSQSSVTTCSEANIVPTVNLSLALYLPFFSPSLQHPRASTHIRFLAFCSILKSSWLRSFLGYKKKKKRNSLKYENSLKRAHVLYVLELQMLLYLWIKKQTFV